MGEIVVREIRVFIFCLLVLGVFVAQSFVDQ